MHTQSTLRWQLFARRPITSLASKMVLLAILSLPQPISAANTQFEYKVIVLQGVTAGGSIRKDAIGLYVDEKKTQLLNQLGADGWEVVAVTGSGVTDHTVYLKRRILP